MEVSMSRFHVSYNALHYIYDNNFQKTQTYTYILLQVFIHSRVLVHKLTMQSKPCIYIQGQQNTRKEALSLFVCFHERYKIVWLKRNISLHTILNKFFSTRTDLEFELKAFGH